MSAGPRRVLLTDPTYKHTLGAARALAAAGFEVDVLGARTSLAAWSRAVRATVGSSRIVPEDRIDELCAVLERGRYDVMLPIGSSSVAFAARHRDAIAALTRVPVVTYDKVVLAMDKHELPRAARDCGVPAPATILADGPEALATAAARLGFPLVMKRRRENEPGATFYARTPAELAARYEEWGRRYGTTPVLQEFVPGVGEGFFALYDRGVLKAAFMHRRVREFPPDGGASCCAESIRAEDLLAAGRRLLDHLEWHGVAMVEFRRDARSGGLQLMELNPKFWGSLDLAIASGVDFPVLAARMALGEEVGPPHAYRVGQRFHWLLGGAELQHVTARPAALGPVLADCLDGRVAGNLRLADPLPTAWLAAYDVWMLWRRARASLG
jgi:predicted ATP-grasp superfamily ATP-dependent carboligase